MAFTGPDTDQVGFVGPETDQAFVGPQSDDTVAQTVAKKRWNPSIMTSEEYRPVWEAQQNRSLGEKALAAGKATVEPFVGAAKDIAATGPELYHAMVKPPGWDQMTPDQQAAISAQNAQKMGATALQAGANVGKGFAQPALKMLSYLGNAFGSGAPNMPMLPGAVPPGMVTPQMAQPAPVDREAEFQKAYQQYLQEQALASKTDAEAFQEAMGIKNPEKPLEATANTAALAAQVAMMGAKPSAAAQKEAAAAGEAALGQKITEQAAKPKGTPTAPELSVGEKMTAATGRKLQSLGEGMKNVSGLPEDFAKWVTDKLTGSPELSEKLGKYVDLGEKMAVPVALLTGGGHAVAKALGLVKGLEATGALTRGVGDLMERLATADPTNPFGRLVAIAKDPSAPSWMRQLTQSPALKFAVNAGNLGKNVVANAAKGAALGAGVSALSGASPEELGQNVGIFGGFGAAHGALHGTHPLSDANLANVARFVQDHIDAGVAPETLTQIKPSHIATAATLEKLDPTTKVRFVTPNDASVPNNPFVQGGKAAGQAGYADAPNKTLWVDPTARDAAAVLHEFAHPLVKSAVANQPMLKETIDGALKRQGMDIGIAKIQYAEAVLNGAGKLDGLAEPERNAAIAREIAERDAQDPDWAHHELFADAFMRHLYGQDIVAAANAGKQKGPDSEFKPATIFPGFEKVMDDGAVKNQVFRLLKAQKDYMPGITEGVGQAVPITEKDMGTEKAPLINGQNKYAVQRADGTVVMRPSSQVKQIERREVKATKALYPNSGRALPENDQSPLVRLRRTIGGLLRPQGTQLGDSFYTNPNIGPSSKLAGKVIEQSFGTPGWVQFWNHGIAEPGAHNWSESAAQVQGNRMASHEVVKPVTFWVSKAGNVLFDAFSQNEFYRKAQRWAQREKGPASLERWGGDIAKFLKDVNQVAANQAAGLPGESNNIGADKKNTINAFLYGITGGPEANPAKGLMRGADRKGVVRTYRLDRVEGINQAENGFEAPPTYETGFKNLTPGTFSPSVDPRAVRAAAVRDKEGNIYEGPMHAFAALQYWDKVNPGDETNFLRAWNKHPDLEEGFATNTTGPDGKPEFLTREQAFDRAVELGQYKPKADDAGSLESTRFAKQNGIEIPTGVPQEAFSPSTERKVVDVEGPDGKKYRVRFDGVWDFGSYIKGDGKRLAFTAMEDLPGVTIKDSSMLGTSLQKAGYKIPEDLQAKLTEKPGKFSPPLDDETRDDRELLQANRYFNIGHENPGSKVWMWDRRNNAVKIGKGPTHGTSFGFGVAEGDFKGWYDPDKKVVSIAFNDRDLPEGRDWATEDDIPTNVYNKLKSKFGKDVKFEVFPKNLEDDKEMARLKKLGEEEGYDFSPAVEPKKEKPGFYSQLEKVVGDKFTGKQMPAAQLAAILRNPQNGVKADEMKWTGLDDFLSGKIKEGKKVTKEEVQNYLANNRLQLNEVTKGTGVEISKAMRTWLTVEGSEDLAVPSTPAGWTRLSEKLERKAQWWKTNGDPENAEKFFKLSEEATQHAEAIQYGNHLLRPGEGGAPEWIDTSDEGQEGTRFELSNPETGEKYAIIEHDPERSENNPWFLYRGDSGRRIRGYYNFQDARAAGDEYAPKPEPPADSPKFAQYQLEGGKNYREILFQLPADREQAKSHEEIKQDAAEGYNKSTPEEKSTLDARSLAVSRRPFLHALSEGMIGSRDFQDSDAPFVKEWRAQIGRNSALPAPFKSSHWDEPNVLAHARINEREDSNGRPGLFVEEIQSDWHQKGRKSGYKPGERQVGRDLRGARVEENPDGTANVVLPNGEVVHQNFRRDLAEQAARIFNEGPSKEATGVPDAPLKTSWHEMVLRRLIQKAAQAGKDWIGWTTGEQQAERYDLSKQLSSVRVTPLRTKNQPEPIYGVDAYDKAGKLVVSESYPRNQLPDVIGKDLADKAVADLEAGKTAYYSGLGLKVGGEGMKGFYDKILVDYANKFGKKFGAKVEDKFLDAGDSTARSRAYDLRETDSDQWQWFDDDRKKVGPVFDSEESANDWQSGGSALEVHTLPITEAMKASVLGEGVSQFSPALREEDYKPAPAETQIKDTRKGAVGTIGAATPEPGARTILRSPEQAHAIDHEHIMTSPDLEKFRTGTIDSFKKYAGFRDLKAKGQEAVKDIVDRVTDNLRFIFDKTTEPERKLWRQWYDFAHAMSEKWGPEFGKHPDVISAINASLSPQTEWNTNVTLTRKILETIRENPVVTPGMIHAIRAYVKAKERTRRAVNLAAVDAIKPGQRISDLNDLQAGMAIRAYNINKGRTPLHDHELNPVKGKYAAWVKAADDLRSAVEIFRNPTFDVVNKELGSNHKVRSFYNNHVAPESPLWTTIDTHAIAAGLMLPVGSKAPEVTQGFNSPGHKGAGYNGTYWIYQRAYENLAKEVGLLPREMQSIVWEKIRQQLEPKRKTALGLSKAVHAVWAKAPGEWTREQARNWAWEAFAKPKE